jgi:hypothetical protein
MSVASILDEAGIRESEMSFVLPVEIEGAETSQHGFIVGIRDKISLSCCGEKLWRKRGF